jgi:hypothetical protein
MFFSGTGFSLCGFDLRQVKVKRTQAEACATVFFAIYFSRTHPGVTFRPVWVSVAMHFFRGD